MRVNFHSASPRPRLFAALVLAAPLLLGGCLVQSKIQGRYVEDQADCRGEAEANVGKYDKAAKSRKDRDAQLVTLFSDCMGKHGWQVGKPKKVAATTNGPAGPLDPYGRGGYGTASGAAAGAAAGAAVSKPTTHGPDLGRIMQSPEIEPATQAPVPAQDPVETKSTILSPGGGQAPLNPPAADAPARYQPARPTTQSPDYGTGAGRQF